MPDLPPPGPERDALVAKALGCVRWTDLNGCMCCDDLVHDVAVGSSTTDAGAIAALRAWKDAGPDRTVVIMLGAGIGGEWVELECRFGYTRDASAPTLGDAASRALIEAAEAGKEGA